MAYKRLAELKKLQESGWSKDRLSKNIGISDSTLIKVLDCKEVSRRTEMTIDYFLDNLNDPEVTVNKLIEYKQSSKTSIEKLSESIGVSPKTIFNVINLQPVSDGTIKLIENFLKKVCV